MFYHEPGGIRDPGHPLSTTNFETHIKSQQEDVGVHISQAATRQLGYTLVSRTRSVRPPLAVSLETRLPL